MRKIVIITTTFLVLSYARTAAAQLYTCTGQNNACTICDFFAMMVNVIGITLKFVVPSAIILAVIAAGVMMMLKQEDPDVWARAKKIMLTAIVGGLVVYGGWLLVSVSLAGMNFTNKDTWWKFELVCTHCGDGVLQAGEECEPGISEVPCDEFCKIIVEQKPVVQDRCGTADGGKSLTEPGVSFDIVRPPRSPSKEESWRAWGYGDTYTCDEVCAARGQKCIGVGLTNVAVNACVSVVHHIGVNCELSENLQQGSGCSDTYRVLIDATCLEYSNPCKPEWEPCGAAGGDDHEEHPAFFVGETACYCQ
jgi:hypothetical protein